MARQPKAKLITRKRITIFSLILLAIFFIYNSITNAILTAIVSSVALCFVGLSMWIVIETLLYTIEKREYLKSRKKYAKNKI